MRQARRFGDKTLSSAKKGCVWQSKTWRQALETLPSAVMGLVSLGLKKGDPVGIASRTRREWSEADPEGIWRAVRPEDPAPGDY